MEGSRRALAHLVPRDCPARLPSHVQPLAVLPRPADSCTRPCPPGALAGWNLPLRQVWCGSPTWAVHSLP